MPAIAHSPYATSAPVAASRIQSSRRTIDAAATASRGLLRPRALVSTASITLRRHPHLNRMSLEVRLEDLECSRRRGGAPVTAVLDQGTDRDRRRVCGRVPAPPGLVELAGEAGDARALLSRPGLTGNGDWKAAEDCRRGSVGPMGRL